MRKFLILLLAALLMLSGCSSDLPLNVPNAQTIIYGKSGSGQYDLTAYRFGTGENVLLLTFCIHGWEDAFDRDGAALVELGNATAEWLNDHTALVEDGDWSVYVLPCLNPDGLHLGTTTNGCGRCTYTSDDGKPVDLNRCFPYQFTPYEEPRCYNGKEPLACAEGRALAAFVPSIMGNGQNYAVDVHGWYQQILTEDPESVLYPIFSSCFPDNRYTSLEAGYGYFSAWCGYTLGFDACLLELPASVNSMEAYRKSNCETAFLSAIEQILAFSCIPE